jgi:hypothetical protein
MIGRRAPGRWLADLAEGVATGAAAALIIAHRLAGAPTAVIRACLPVAPSRPRSGHDDLARELDAESIEHLVYELLDAHADTARLAGTGELDPEWEVHLDYLRRLQRVGREQLAGARR